MGDVKELVGLAGLVVASGERVVVDVGLGGLVRSIFIVIFFIFI